jgi:hypothetical protein
LPGAGPAALVRTIIPRKLLTYECEAVSAELIFVETRRVPQRIIAFYFQGAQRRIGGNEPAETGRGSIPLALASIDIKTYF